MQNFPSSFSTFLSCLLSIPTLTFFFYLKHSKHVPTSGSVHLLLPLLTKSLAPCIPTTNLSSVKVPLLHKTLTILYKKNFYFYFFCLTLLNFSFILITTTDCVVSWSWSLTHSFRMIKIKQRMALVINIMYLNIRHIYSRICFYSF